MTRTRALAFLSVGLLTPFLRAQTTLHFPTDRAVGVVWTRDAARPHDYSFQDWQRLAEARGDVPVPAGQQVKLDVGTDSAHDLSFLRHLPPDSIHFLQLASASLGPARLRDVAHLTGLKILYLNDTPLQGDDLAPVATLPALDELWVGHTGLTDAVLAPLHAIKSLKHLTAWQNPLSDAGMKTVADLRSLEDLWLSSDDIGDEGARLIASLPKLKTLGLSETHVRDAGLAALGRSPSLRELDIMSLPVTPAGLHGLSPANLTLLRLDGKSRVTDDCLKEIGHITTLEQLYLAPGSTPAGLRALLPLKHLRNLELFQETDDQGLAALATLPALQELRVAGSGITDAGVAQLAASLKLKELGLSDTKVTAASLQRLAAVPTLESLSLGNNPDLDLAGLKHVAPLPNLKRLYLLGTPRVGTDAADAIGRMQHLEHLQLWCDGLTDPELTSIANAKSLKFAQFDCRKGAARFTDAGAKALANLTAVESLMVWGGDLTDAALPTFARLATCQYLQVSGRFTDAGLASLEGMPSLHLLTLTGTFSPRAVDRLKQRTPSLQDARLKTDAPVQPAKVGDPAPDFDLVALDGRHVSTKDLRGHPVVLYFWATWCAPCVAWTPELKKLQAELAPQGVQWVSLSLDDLDHHPKRYAEEHGLTWPQLRIGLDSPLADAYGVRGVPTIIILSPTGKITARDLRSTNAIRQVTHPEAK